MYTLRKTRPRRLGRVEHCCHSQEDQGENSERERGEGHLLNGGAWECRPEPRPTTDESFFLLLEERMQGRIRDLKEKQEKFCGKKKNSDSQNSTSTGKKASWEGKRRQRETGCERQKDDRVQAAPKRSRRLKKLRRETRKKLGRSKKSSKE